MAGKRAGTEDDVDGRHLIWYFSALWAQSLGLHTLKMFAIELFLLFTVKYTIFHMMLNYNFVFSELSHSRSQSYLCR